MDNESLEQLGTRHFVLCCELNVASVRGGGLPQIRCGHVEVTFCEQTTGDTTETLQVQSVRVFLLLLGGGGGGGG